MSTIEISLPDGTTRRFPSGVTAADVAADIGERLAQPYVAAMVGDKVVGLSEPITADSCVCLLTFKDMEGQEVYRHSTAHVMAHAVQRLFPEAKVAIGPAIEEGFYYDFDVAEPFTPADLQDIETEMKKIIEDDLPIRRLKVTRDDAKRIFTDLEEPYKLELLEAIPESEPVILYQTGDEWTDLCRGPHLPRTGRIKAFKLLSASGAYWRGDERNKMLQRIYGTSFPTQKELDAYLRILEERARRDHRKLGRELDLFSMHDDCGAGLILWHPNGAAVRKAIEDFWRAEHERRGYQLVFSPHIARVHLWNRSGHTSHYRENMYSPIDIEGQEYYLKPMNCPFHIAVFNSRTRSYRDLPIRYAELGTVYRYERSGVLHGLLRVRGFTQDDAHIFCTPEQLKDEIAGVVDFAIFMLSTFGFDDFQMELATRPEKYTGSLEGWETAESTLVEVLNGKGIAYKVDEGGGVFYGPKIDVKLRDSLGHLWQGPTIQFDFNLPERLNVKYIGADGREHYVYMVHRTVLGSMERFMGNLIEHYGGAFPVWLAPVQVILLPISDKHYDYAADLCQRMRQVALRVEVDYRSQKTGAKVAEAETRKIPYMVVVGDREVQEGSVSVRSHGSRNLGGMSAEAFIEKVVTEVRERCRPERA